MPEQIPPSDEPFPAIAVAVEDDGDESNVASTSQAANIAPRPRRRSRTVTAADAYTAARIVTPQSFSLPANASQTTVPPVDMSTKPKVPQPGPARLKRNAGPDEWLEAAKNCKYLSEPHMKQLCEMVKEYMMEGRHTSSATLSARSKLTMKTESNIQPVSTPVTICGDIHGQFYDLLELFRVAGGMPGETNPQEPTTAPQNLISTADIEPPSTITNPKLKKKLKIGQPEESNESSEVSDAGEVESNADSAEIRTLNTNFVFLGDYVDRGYFSLETLTLLLCLKAKYVPLPHRSKS